MFELRTTCSNVYATCSIVTQALEKSFYKQKRQPLEKVYEKEKIKGKREFLPKEKIFNKGEYFFMLYLFL